MQAAIPNTEQRLRGGREPKALFGDTPATVSSCGFVAIPAHHLRWAKIQTHAGCTAKIHAAERTITLSPAHGDRFVFYDGTANLTRELNALGVCPDRCTEFPPRIERVVRDHHRELIIRFAPEAMKQKVLKNKGHSGKSIAPARRAGR